ncbi:MAG: CHAT domain-containing protein [Methanobacterium sp.]|uniref:CHAT domain-containing protein n=1 Tax=Methanobacterium sp. TaxID=2164 RepID=UPI003D656501|nr:CHAT domain-containing protein [Methanobacterium sp.]
MDPISKTIDLFLDTNNGSEFTINANFSTGNVIDSFKLSQDEKEFLKRLDRGISVWDIEKEIGKQLYKLIFKNEILSNYEEIKRQLSGESVNLKLIFSKRSIEILGLPWELLHDENRFLVSSGKLNLVRCIEGAESSSINISLPLRILIIISRPLNVDKLDNLIEGEAVVKGLYSLKLNNTVIIDFLNPPTHNSLVKALDNNEYHIVHFDGHGAFQDGKGYLVFEDEFLKYDLIDSDIISNVFSSTNIKLIVLTACQSSTIGTNVFNSIAPALIQAGIPSVVAMQFSVPLKSAVKFVEHFYNSLSNSKNLTHAVMQGRKVIYRDNTWFIPTLYASNLIEEIFIHDNGFIDLHEPHSQHILFENKYYEPNFVGRAEQLIKLSKSVSSTKTNCIVIWGSGGIGKTSLLKQYILRQHWRFNDEIIWIDLKGGKSLNKILDQICSDQKLNCDKIENLKSHIYQYLKSKSLLIVFDNFEDVEEDEEISEFIKFIPRPTRAIITARNNPLVMNWKKIQLYKLSLEESFELFYQLAESMDVIIDESNFEYINEICRVIEGHPLALVLVAQMLLSNSINVILNKIKSYTLKGIELALSVSYNDLNKSEQTMIQKLSVFDSYFDEEAIKFVSEIENFEEIKDELVRCSFLHFDGEKFSIHPVIKQYVYNKIANKKKYHLKAARYYQSKNNHFPMVDQIYYAEEWGDFLATMRQLLSPLSLRGMPDLSDAVKRVDMIYKAVEKLGDDTVKWVLRLDIGTLYRQVGLIEESLEEYENAYNLAVKINDFEGKWRSLAKKVQMYATMGDSQVIGAINELENLIEGNDEEEVRSVYLISSADGYLISGVKEDNEDYLRESGSRYKEGIEIMENQENPDALMLAQAYNSFGQVNMYLNDNKNAFKYLNKSLELKKHIGDLYGASVTLSILSDLNEKLGKLQEARDCLNEIILISEKICFSNALEYDFLKLGKFNIILEEYEKVPELFAHAIVKSLDSKDDSIETIMEEIENELIALSEKSGVIPPAFIIGLLTSILTDNEFIKTLPAYISKELPRIVEQLCEIPHKIDSKTC